MTIQSVVCILCLWNIQLDWVGIEPHGAYPRKSDLNCCKHVQEILRWEIFAEIRTNEINANGQYM